MADVPDFTGKYNTNLSPVAEQKFQRYLHESGREGDLKDYDLRGAWLYGATESDDGHLPDTYKKPNHPTFSDESIYSGKDGNVGGKWKPADGDAGSWTYQPSETNLRYRSKEDIEAYFKEQEKGSSIAWDALTKPKPE